MACSKVFPLSYATVFAGQGASASDYRREVSWYVQAVISFTSAIGMAFIISICIVFHVVVLSCTDLVIVLVGIWGNMAAFRTACILLYLIGHSSS